MPAVPAGQGGGGCKKIPHQLRLAAALAWVAERAGGALQVQAPAAPEGGCRRRLRLAPAGSAAGAAEAQEVPGAIREVWEGGGQVG